MRKISLNNSVKFPLLLFSLLICLLCILSACKQSALSGLEQVKAYKIANFLAYHGIKAEVGQMSNSRYDITLEAKDLAGALVLLEKAFFLENDSVPKEQHLGLFASREEKQEQVEKNRIHELETALENIQSVLRAKVILSPKTDSTRRSCVVLIFIASDTQLNPRHLRRMVAAALGLKAQDVEVKFQNQNLESRKKNKLLIEQTDFSYYICLIIGLVGLTICLGKFLTCFLKRGL